MTNTKCKYAEMCKFYRSADYACNSEISEFCGTYSIFANFRPSKKLEAKI